MRLLPLAIKLDYRIVFEYIKPPRPSTATLWWLFAVVVSLVTAFVVYDILSRQLRRRRAQEQSAEDFNQLVLVCQLASDEVSLLRHLVGVCAIEFPDRLFTSFELFNSCLEEKGPAATGPVSESDAARLRLIRNKIFFGERSRIPPISTTHELKSNQWLHLQRLGTGEVFLAPVVEAGVSGLLVTTPRPEGEYIEFRPGERLDVYFWRERDASYHFESQIVGQTGTHYLITVLKHAEEVERIQRRQFHRIDISVAVNAIPVTRAELERVGCGEAVDTRGHPGFPAYIVDISAAGFALASRTALRPGDLVYIEIPTDEDGETAIPIMGKILSVTEREHTDESLMHAEFAGLSTERHEKIYWFIYTHAEKRAMPIA